MKLSLPEEMDDPPEGSSGKQSGSSGKQGERIENLSNQTVTLMGDEMGPLGAIELLGEMLERPESFGLVPSSRLTDLNERIAEVEAENGRLRRDLAVLWVHQSAEAAEGEHVIPDGEGMGVAPESVNMYDPVGEFDG